MIKPPEPASAIVFLPEHQRSAARELHQSINDKLNPLFGKIINDLTIAAFKRAIQEAVVDWNQKYPILNKYNIGFELVIDGEHGKIKIIPSPDFQKLLAGQII
jgi:hypothetical protein